MYACADIHHAQLLYTLLRDILKVYPATLSSKCVLALSSNWLSRFLHEPTITVMINQYTQFTVNWLSSFYMRLVADGGLTLSLPVDGQMMTKRKEAMATVR